MAFVSNFSSLHPTKNTDVTCCAAKPPKPKAKHPRSRRPRASPPTSSQPDVWDTLIDDNTTIEDILHPEQNQYSTIQCSQARMAPRQSGTPKPQFTSQTQPDPDPPKKKRGRPKGSRSPRTPPIPPPPVSPFMSAVREDLRRRNLAANRDLVSGILDMQAGQDINWDQLQLVAPNGLPDDESKADLLQELLPILAQQESEENRIPSEEELRMKQLISTCYTQFSSIHRSSDRLDNLKPYKLKAETEHDCNACNGTGMTVCEYCEGEGYVDLGENGEKFNPKFRNNEFTMPKRVTGNIYHCPLCGGLQKERCISCFGTGTITDAGEFIAGAAKASKDDRAWKIFDMDELMRREADRIEVGLDGLVIMRAKPRGRRKKDKAGEGSEKAPVRRARRGRPAKDITKDVTTVEQWDDATKPPDAVGIEADADPSAVTSPGTIVIPRGRPVVRTTDFVNTTDYQVGRRLQRQSPTVGPGFSSSSDSSSSSAQVEDDEIEELADLHE